MAYFRAAAVWLYCLNFVFISGYAADAVSVDPAQNAATPVVRVENGAPEHLHRSSDAPPNLDAAAGRAGLETPVHPREEILASSITPTDSQKASEIISKWTDLAYLSQSDKAVLRKDGITSYEKLSSSYYDELLGALKLIAQHDHTMFNALLTSVKHIVVADLPYSQAALTDNHANIIVIGKDWLRSVKKAADLVPALAHEGTHIIRAETNKSSSNAVTEELQTRQATVGLYIKVFGSKDSGVIALQFEIDQVKKSKTGLMAKFIAGTFDGSKLGKTNIGTLYNFMMKFAKDEKKRDPVFMDAKETTLKVNGKNIQTVKISYKADGHSYDVYMDVTGKVVKDTWDDNHSKTAAKTTASSAGTKTVKKAASSSKSLSAAAKAVQKVLAPAKKTSSKKK